MKFDPERVRLAIERRALEELRAGSATAGALERPQTARQAELDLAREAIRLDESMAPGLFGPLQTARERLGITRDVALYLSRGGRDGTNASLVCAEDFVAIRLLGDPLGVLDPGAVLALFGHELGHLLLHIEPPWGAARRLALRDRRGSTFHLATELSADRFELLASRDLHAALRLEMASVMGKTTQIARNAEAYLADCRDAALRMLEGGAVSYGWNHAEHVIRAYSLSLFSESDVYALITEEGSGRLAIENVDATIAKLLPSAFGVAQPPVDPRNGLPQNVSCAPRPAWVPRAVLDAPVRDLPDNVVDRAAAGAALAIERTFHSAADLLDAAAKRIGREIAPSRRQASVDPHVDDDLERRFQELERKSKGR